MDITKQQKLQYGVTTSNGILVDGVETLDRAQVISEKTGGVIVARTVGTWQKITR